MEKLELTDRYKMLNLPYPDINTMCDGQCEGTGIIPVYMQVGDKSMLKSKDEDNKTLIELWKKAEEECPSKDGYHFVKCPDCDGAGKK